MTIRLNDAGLAHARKLVRDGHVVRDERDEWSAHRPSADDENRFLDRHGWKDYAAWHLGIDTEASEETKGRFEFPFGDLTRVRRSAVIACEARAAQNDHDDIADAAKKLLELIDAD